MMMGSTYITQYQGQPYNTTNYMTLEGITVKLPKYVSKYIPKYRAEIVGWDTETEKDNLRVVCNSNTSNNCLIYNDERDRNKLWAFIMHRNNKGKYNMMFNMRYDYTAFLKALGLTLEQFEELQKTNSVKVPVTTQRCVQEYKIKLLSGKFISFSDSNGDVVNFYDLANFCKGTLEYNILQNFKLTDKEKALLNQLKTDRPILFEKYHLLDIVNYCYRDAVYTQKIFMQYCEAYERQFQSPPTRPYSMASWAGTQLRLQTYVPKMRNLPDGLLEFWYRAFYGGRFEILGRGTYPNLYLTDMTGAYPEVMKDLYNPCEGVWRKTCRVNENSTYGVYKVVVLNNVGQNLYPLPFRYGNGVIVYPQDVYITWAVKEELELVHDYEVITGWEFYIDRPYKPLYNYITGNQRRRGLCYKQGLKLDGDLIKGINVSSFGKTVQTIGGHTGKFFNPIWGTLITALTRVKMYKIALQNPTTIGIHSDSFITKEPLKGVTLGNDIGNFKEVTTGSGYLMSAGRYKVGDEYGERGFSRLMDAIDESDGNTTKIVVPQTRVVTIPQIVNCKIKYHYEDLNKFITQPFVLDINSEYRRDWERQWKSLNDFRSTNMSSTAPVLWG